MTERIFSFGYGQTCPFTGKSLVDHYAAIVAPDPDTARALMFAVFGPEWSFEYESLDKATRGGQFPMVEHIRITLGGGS